MPNLGPFLTFLGIAFAIIGLAYGYSVVREIFPNLRFRKTTSSGIDALHRISENAAAEARMAEELERRFMAVSFHVIRSRRIDEDLIVFLARNDGGAAKEARVRAKAPIEVHLNPEHIEPDGEVQFTCSNVPLGTLLIEFEMVYIDCADTPRTIVFSFGVDA